jgi:hypothetical protein
MNPPNFFDPLSTTLTVLEIGFVVCVAVLICASVGRTRWGFNLTRVTCPDCSAPQPGLRKPATWKQALWGGYICPSCACEMDKWGRRLAR